METQRFISLADLPPTPVYPGVLLIVTRDSTHQGQTELIARLALRGPFHLILDSDWLPDQERLRRTVHRYTLGIQETLDHPILGRPSTCLQLRDQLMQAESQKHLILILDFLHHFYNPDVDLRLRQRVLEQCCPILSRLSKSRPVMVIVPRVALEDYERFFPILASTADEVLEAEGDHPSLASQPRLF